MVDIYAQDFWSHYVDNLFALPYTNSSPINIAPASEPPPPKQVSQRQQDYLAHTSSEVNTAQVCAT